jgi:hypothetical protein
MPDVSRRTPGETIVLQEIWRGRVWAARPMRVVRDDDLVALWFPRGTRWRAPTTPPTRPREATRAERFVTSLGLGDWTYAKDEDELETLVAAGILDAETDRRVRDEALHVIERAERAEPPFSEPWPDWRPSRGWTLPELPTGWEAVAEPCR